MTTAFVFAGQGVDPPWIEPRIVELETSRLLVEAASDATGIDVRRALARGDAALSRVEVLQPALVAACLMAVATVAPPTTTTSLSAASSTAGPDASLRVEPAVACGHSLGELAACAAAGYIAPTDAVAVAAIRGRLMAREAAAHPGAMAAVPRDLLGRALAIGAQHGRIVHAADNTPTEQIVSGDEAAVRAVVTELRCRRLAVAGAWHSPLMAGAVDELREALAAVCRTPAASPSISFGAFVTNFDGSVADAADIPRLLANQLVQPIRFPAVVRTLRTLGVTRIVIPGPGKLVRALLRENLAAIDAEAAPHGDSGARRAIDIEVVV